MNTKRNKFRFLRFLTYFIGFPALCITMLFLMAPTLNNPMYQKFGKICVLVPVLAWGLFEIVKVILRKFARKGSLKADVATLILIIVTLSFTILPTVITDLNLSKKYKAFTDKLGTQETVMVDFTDPITGDVNTEEMVLYKGSWLPTYSKVMGWGVDNTSKGNSYLQQFANEVNGYISANKLAGFGNSEKGNSESKVVDYDINLDGKIDSNDVMKIGLKRGLYSDLDFKIEGKKTYTILAEQLNRKLGRLNEVKGIYAENILKITNRKIKVQNGETIEDPTDKSRKENVLIDTDGKETVFGTDIATLDSLLKEQQTLLDQFNKEHAKDIIELGGQRVRIYDDTIKALLDIIQSGGEILPDGLNIVALGLDLPVGQIVKFLGDLVGGLGSISPAIIDTIVGAVCSSTNDNPASNFYNHKYLEISLGMAQRPLVHKCAATATAISTENGYDYTATRALKDKISFYPQVLVFARFRRVMYVFMGFLILSILLSTHYSRKIKQIDNILFNTHTQKVLESKGYVLKSEMEEKLAAATASTVSNNNTNIENITSPLTEVNTTTSPTPIILDLNAPKAEEPKKEEVTPTPIIIKEEEPKKEEVKEENKPEVKEEPKEDIPRPVGLDLSALQGGNKNEK